MKKLLLTVTCLFAVIIINAQSLEEIIGKYTVANKLDKISEFKTIKITAKTSMMGMEMPMEIWMKNPNKIKTVTSYNGQNIVQAFDGEKGYMINPMAGSNDPVEMNADQVKDIARNNIFQNYMATYFKNGQLVLEGEDNVNGKPAYKVKADLDGTNKAYMYIDKSSYLLIKTVADINQGGMAMTVESYPTDYTETSGIFLPMKTTTTASGMEIITTFSKVEVDIPIEDSIFKIK
jgi:outer membrane lipoprotein-sorting protein